MRHVVVAGFLVAAAALCADYCDADEDMNKAAVRETAPAQPQGAGLRHIDLGSSEQASDSGTYPMETWETYDQNTGLPDVTQSDAAFELE